MTRVLIIEAAGRMWGSERALLDLLAGLENGSAAVCCPARSPLELPLRNRGVRVLPYLTADLHKKSKWQRAAAVVAVLRACFEFRPRVIYLNQSGLYKIALWAARLTGLPIIAHVRIFDDVAYLERLHPDPRRLKRLIAISEAIERAILAGPALRRIPVSRIYDAYAPSPRRSIAANPERSAARIACVGRIVPIKAQELLISALDELKSEPGFECIFAGDGEPAYVSALKKTAQESGAHVRWAGFVEDVVPLLSSCAALICPSHLEPLGRVIFEAWDAGAVPVVYAGSGGAAEIVSASGGGIIYEKQDPRCVADAVRKALRLTGEEKAAMCRNGRAWCETHCAPAEYGASIRGILAEAGESA